MQVLPEAPAAEPVGRPPAPGWLAVSAAFGALGRVFLCLDSGFRILHASEALDGLLGAGASSEAQGRPAEEFLGSGLFGAEAPLRRALMARERREGWRAALPGRGDAAARLVAVTAAPITPEGAWDSRMSYIVVLRPAEDEQEASGAPATPAVSTIPPRSTDRLLQALEENRWRRVDAARTLGVSRTTLWRMMREAGIGR